MKITKKLVASLMMVLVFAAAVLPFAASAASVRPVKIYDSGKIATEDVPDLTEYSRKISAACGMEACFFLATPFYANTQTLTEYTQAQFKDVTDGFVLVVEEKNKLWEVVTFGRAENRVTEEIANALYAAYAAEESYYDAVEAYLTKAGELLAKVYAGAVDDFTERVGQSNFESLRRLSAEVSTKCKMDIAFVFAPEGHEGSIREYIRNYYQNEKKLGADGIVLGIDETSWAIEAFGATKTRLSDEMEDRLYDVYEKSDSYSGGIQDYLELAGEVLAASGATLARVPEGERLARLTDDMDLLTDEQETQLLAKLDEISERQKFDVVVAVVPALDDREARLYAIDFFEENGFGYDGTQDGAILLLAMAERDFGFASQGYGNTVFTVAGQEYLDKLFLPDLKKDQYFEGFMAFADGVDDFVTQAKAGAPYEEGNIPKTEQEKLESHVINLVVSLGIALLVAWIITNRWKAQLKSVAVKTQAAQYVRPGSLVITGHNDMFLYSNVTSVRRVQESSSSGGGSSSGGSFSSSSGSSSTGHSGKF